MTLKTCNINPLKSKRGRPTGSKNKLSEEVVLFNQEEDMFKPKKRRGRPPKKTPESAGHLDLDDSDNDIDPEDAPCLYHETGFSRTEDAIEKVDDDDADEIEIIKKHTLALTEKIDKPDKKNYYVDSKRLEALIEQYNEDGKIVDELAIALYNISFRMSFSPNFINYSWKEEMIGDGLVKEFTALKNKKYDPARGRAFSYFSMIVFNAFCNKIKKENKNNQALKDYQNEQHDSLFFEQSEKTTHNHEEHDD